MEMSTQVESNECRYKENDRKLKEQFINYINDDKIMTEIT